LLARARSCSLLARSRSRSRFRAHALSGTVRTHIARILLL
jgi:hypothetical protein